MKKITKIIMLLVAVLLCSCGNSRGEKSPSNKSDYNYRIENSYSQGVSSSNIPIQNSNKTAPAVNERVIGRYDEGLLDGEAAAEEDRLAGKPGMQIGDDDGDDEEDYEDGYDDGYDE